MEPKRRTLHWAWVILAICFVNLFINYSVRLGYGVVLPEMIRTLGFGRTAGGSIYNSYLFTYIAVTPFTGYLTDRFGARRVIAICLLISGIGVLLMGTVHVLWTACFFYALVGLGATGLWAPVITLVQRWFAFHRRGLALGILSTGYGLGFAVMGIGFPWVVNHFSWRYGWYFLGTAALLMTGINSLFLRSDPAHRHLKPWGQGPSSADQRGGMPTVPPQVMFAAIYKDRRFWLIGFSYFAIAYSLYRITTFMVDYAKYQLELPLEKASLLATIHGVGQIGGVLTVLPLSDYLGRRKTIIISNAAITAALLGIIAFGKSWVMLGVFIGCLALFYGATFPIYGACAGDYFPSAAMGTVIGAWTPFYGLGAILTHWITGILRDATGRYDQAFIICAIMAAVALFLIYRVRRGTPSDPGGQGREAASGG
ncbi:MAG: MFS transporter [Desulfobacterales bacterium]|nr:MAG: MFS transporter [Desulfobacterales bacterium]